LNKKLSTLMQTLSSLVSRLRSFAAIGVIAVSSVFASNLLAQTNGKLPDFYKEPGLQPNRDYVNQHFGEHIDPFTGALQLHYVDVHIPGPAGFDLKIQRSYNSASVDRVNPKHHSMMGVGWSFHMGRVFKTGTDICSNTDPDSGNDNPVLELPDGSTQRLYFTSSGSPLMQTQRWWKAACISGTTQGLLITSPDGTSYRMDRQYAEGTVDAPVYAYYATRITDRNGNTMDIAYNTATLAKAEITGITSSASGSVTISYNDTGTATRRVSSITGPSGTWNYNYTQISGKPGVYQLTGVDRPVSGNWSYSYNNFGFIDTAGNHMMSGLAMPQGGSIAYNYTNISVDNAAGGVSPPSMVTRKTAGGGTWTWTYSPASSVGSLDTTTVSTPAGTHTYKHFGANSVGSGNVWKIGLLDSKSLGSTQSESYSWDKVLVSGEPNNREGMFASKGDTDTYTPVMTGRTITRSSTSFSTTYSSFDSYGNPGSISESGPNGGSRSTSATYFTSTSKWIIGKLKDESRTGGQNVTRSYDADGNMTQICRDSVCTGYGYDSAGNVSSMTNDRGFSTTYSGYFRGTPQSESRPAGVSVSRSVSSAGNVTSESVGGQSFSYGYDGINRVTSIGYPAGSNVSISYGASSKTATRGTLTESTSYNSYGYITNVTVGGIGIGYTVDALGRRTSETNPGGGGTISYTLDILGRATNISLPGGASRGISYGGSSMTVTDERGFSTIFSYRSYGDPSVQILTGISAPQQSTSIGRNSRDLISSVTQGGITRSYGYNSNFFLTSIADPETGTTTFGRDGNGNMTSRTVGGATTTYAYDGLDRQTQAAYPGGPTINKTYNPRGKVLTVTGGTGNRSYGYDDNDNLTSETLTIDSRTFTASYGYTGLDQLASITYPKTGRVVNYSPNILGRPTQVSGFVTGVTYFDSGQVNRITYSGGGTATYGQNSRLWPTGFTAVKGSTQIDSTYTYDGTGNITGINDAIDNSFDRTLGYDGIGRLTTANGPWGSGSYTYDGVGNITQRVLGNQTTNFNYNGDNLLTALSGARTATFTYGNHATITNDGSNTYQYNGVPNLTCVNCADTAKKIDYAYDGTHMRTKKVQSGVTTYEFHNAMGQLLLEYSPSADDRTVEHIYLGSKRIAQETNDTTVPKTATTTMLNTSTTSTSCGNNITLTATVSPSAATGIVEFLDGGALIGTANLNSGTATLTIALQRPGTRSLTARYVGSATYEESTSAARSVSVSSVSNSITISYNPSTPPVPNQPLSIIATVTGCLQGDGQIEFKTSAAGSVSSIPTATIALNNTRSATHTFSPAFSTNTYRFRATLKNDSIGNNDIYEDGEFQVKYIATPTITGVTPSAVGQFTNYTISATATSSSGSSSFKPVGNIDFYDGTTYLGSGYFNGTAAATRTVTQPHSVGTHPLTAVFTGDSAHPRSAPSAIFNLPILPASRVSVSLNPVESIYGDPVTFTANVTNTSNQAISGGSVEFVVYDPGPLRVLGTVNVVNGVASLVVNDVPTDLIFVRARFLGSATHGSSESAEEIIVINKRQPSITVTGVSPNPATSFAPVTVNATVSTAPAPASSVAIAGSVRIDGGAVEGITFPGVGSGTSTSATRTSTRIARGAHTITVSIPETKNFLAAASPPVAFTATGALCKLDINQTTLFDAPDGRAFLSWMTGFRGDSLLAAAQPILGMDGNGIDTFIKPQAEDLFLDLDGDGQVLAMRDGLMLVRIALELTGTAVTANAVNPAGTRPDWASIRTYLNTNCSLNLP
jgi:YD repeat-containing protein